MSKRKILIIIAVCIVAIVAAVTTLIVFRNQRFELSNEYYESSEILPITIDELRAKIEDKQSFAVFVSQIGCRTADNMRKNLEQFIASHHFSLYEINFSTLRESGIVEGLRYYPSFLIYHDGNLVDFLDANSDSDADAYTSYDGFEQWFTEYVKLRA